MGSTLIMLLAASLSTYAMLGAHRKARPEPVAPAPDSIRTSTQGALTRADSEAIAAAFARRILEQRGTVSPAPIGTANQQSGKAATQAPPRSGGSRRGGEVVAGTPRSPSAPAPGSP